MTVPSSPIMGMGHRKNFYRPPLESPPQQIISQERSRQHVIENLFEKHQRLQYGYTAMKTAKPISYNPRQPR